MKKIMIAAVAVAFSAAAQAAAITWGSGAIQNAKGEAAKATVTAYLLSTTAADYAKYSSFTDGEALSKAIAADYSKSLSGGTKSTTKSVANLKDTADYAVGKTAYSVILYTYNDGTQDLYMGNVGAFTFDAASDFTVANMSKFIGGGETGANATAWAAASVPEPTSGLLLLLGMAGLALKRRRA